MNNIVNYTEYDKQFYPTPTSFLEQIKTDFSKEIKKFHENCKYDIHVLEPSAGKGDIAKYLTEQWGQTWSFTPRCKVDCIEIDKNLQSILKDKGFTVVYDDFLTFNSYTRYDLIFMNPPFKDGEKHLLKAIDMQKKFGGQICCILNSETIRNAYTKTRSDLIYQLDKLNANIRYYDNAFMSEDSERKARVETAVIWIDVPVPEQYYNSKIFNSLDKAKKIKIEIERTEEQRELIKMGLDWVTAAVAQYNEHLQAAEAFFTEYNAFTSIYNTRFSQIENDKYGSPFSIKIWGKDNNGIDDYFTITRRLYWQKLFSNPKFSARLTTKLVSELNSRLDEMKYCEFNERNILRLMEENINATVKGIESEILSLFDRFTKNAIYDGCENVHYYNGWKTNSAYKINNKIVIPFYGVWKKETNYKFHGTGFGGYCTVSGYSYKLDDYEAIRTLTDVSKTLNYLAKGVCGLENTENLAEKIRIEFSCGNAKNIKTQYFTLTFYKKGTCHLKFNNQDLLDKFNLFASQRKGWLPPSYGKKPYEDLDAEEKTVADSFSGDKENYNKIFKNQEKYLVENKELLQLTAV